MNPRIFRMIISALAVMLILSLVTYASATTAEELLRNPDLTETERNAIAAAIGKQSQTDSFIPTNLKGLLEWQKMGSAFASTIKSICQTLNVEVNAFLKSDVGMLTAGIIVYRMVGQDILRIVLYTGIWFAVTFFVIMSIRFLHMKKLVPGTIENPDDPNNAALRIQTTVAIDRFGWEDDIVKNSSLLVHIIIWFVFTCVLTYHVI